MHKLSDIDISLRTAVCAICGPVKLRTAGHNKGGSIRWRCASIANPHNFNLKAKNKPTYIEARNRILDHYGHECSWCGENDSMVLTIDHVDNDGNHHRKQASPRGILSQIIKAIKSGLTHKFQVLCANCNLAKVKNGGVLPEHRKNLHRIKLNT